MSSVHIIGGGVTGLCSAYFLHQQGFEVTVIDAGNIQSGCSFGNAGMITPSHFAPLASPEVISKGLRWMFKSSSPFYIRPRLDINLLRWIWQFYKSANHSSFKEATAFMAEFQLLSRHLYEKILQPELGDFKFKPDGILMLAKTKKVFSEFSSLNQSASEVDIRAQILDPTEVRKMEPLANRNLAGGLYFPQDAHMDPSLFIRSLYRKLVEVGVKFRLNTPISNFESNAGKISLIRTIKGEQIHIETLLICAGSWSPFILKKLGIRMLLQVGKGYSITIDRPKYSPRIPLILEEAAVAITPMGNKLRIGGTMEIGGMNDQINIKRVAAITSSLSDFIEHINVPLLQKRNVWYGYRPCSADGLPFLGKYRKYQNLWVCTGHAMQGMSLGPASGLLISEMMSGKKKSVSTSNLDPGRF